MFLMDFIGFVSTNDLSFVYFVSNKEGDYFACMNYSKINVYKNFTEQFSKLCQHV